MNTSFFKNRTHSTNQLVQFLSFKSVGSHSTLTMPTLNLGSFPCKVSPFPYMTTTNIPLSDVHLSLETTTLQASSKNLKTNTGPTSPDSLSSHEETIYEAIQTAQQSVQAFINQSTLNLINSKLDTGKCLKLALADVETKIKNSLINLQMNLSHGKHLVLSIIKVRRGDPQKNIKNVHLNSYLNSLRHLRQIAENITNEQIYYLHFMKKFCFLFMTKESASFKEFEESFSQLSNSIATHANSKIFDGLIHQQSCFKELRTCIFTTGSTTGKDNRGALSSRNSRTTNFKGITDEEIEKMCTFQTQVIPSTARLFVSEVNKLTGEFHTNISNKAANYASICNSQKDEFYQVLSEAKVKYNPFLNMYDVGPHVPSESTISTEVRVNNDFDADEFIRAVDESEDFLHYCSNPSSNESEFSSKVSKSRRYRSDQNGNLNKPKRSFKNLIKLIDLWDTELTSLFNKNSANKAVAIKTLKSTSTHHYKKLKYFIKKQKENCVLKIQSQQQKLLRILRNEIKKLGTSSSPHLDGPVPIRNSAIIINLLNLDLADPSFQVENTLREIKDQHKIVLQTISKWTHEFKSFTKNTIKEFRQILEKNCKHIDPYTLQEHKFHSAKLMIRTPFQEIRSATSSSQQMVQDLITRLKLIENNHNLEVYFKNTTLNFEHLISVFCSRVQYALNEFDIFMKQSADHVAGYFNSKFDLTKGTLSEIQQSLMDFKSLLEKSVAGSNTINIVSVRTNSNCGQDNHYGQHFGSYMKLAQDLSSKYGSHRVFMPTILPPPPIWSINPSKCKGSKSRYRVKNKNNFFEVIPLLEDGGFCPTKRSKTSKDSSFMKQYIDASREEMETPEWALVHFN